MLVNPGHDVVTNTAAVSGMQRCWVFSIGHDNVVFQGKHEGAGADACSADALLSIKK
jgi:hypothetical protein